MGEICIIKEKSKKIGKKSQSSDVISLKLHGLKLIDESNVGVLDSLFKTYNSAKRCAIKRFQSIGLNGMMKGVEPKERSLIGNFKNFEVDGDKRCFFGTPDGMSKEMYLQMRLETYLKKRSKGLEKASRLWQIDKDLGSPIYGTEKLVGEWLKSNEFTLDSIFLHNAILDALKTYKGFVKKQSRYQTKKHSPSFGNIVERSQKKISKEEFQLTRNGSITIIGNKGGNQKFKFNLEDKKISLIFKRKKIEFDIKSNRFSSKGYEQFVNIVNLMNQGKIPVTMTLTRTNDNGKFNLTLSYSHEKYSNLTKNDEKPSITKKNHILSSIYFTDEVLCHQVVDVRKNKILHFKKYDISEISGRKKNLHSFSTLEWEGKFKELGKLNRRILNATNTETSKLLNKIFKINKSYGVGSVVMESPKSRNSRNFNHSLLEFDANKIKLGNAMQCFMSSSKLMKMIKNQCRKNEIKFNLVNGAFLQLEAVKNTENDMNEALRNACLILVKRNFTGFDTRLTDWGKMMSQHPSMLDWVRHLLHNKRNRQARCEIRKAFQERAVEKAVRLCDGRSKCKLKNEGRHSHSIASSN